MEPRDAARLLECAPDGAIADLHVRDLLTLLRPGDRLVVNDSKVLPVRLSAERQRGEAVAQVELTLVTPVAPGVWDAFAKPAKRLAAGDVLRLAAATGTVMSRDGATVRVAFEGDPLADGVMPLPPYIAARRAPDKADRDSYQTVYSEPPGSVAAPTAGLHFTERLLADLGTAGIGLSRVTLHVGAGTFLPVTSETIDAHVMHAETGEVSAATVEAIAATKAAGGRIVAVGTTSLRLLETAAAGRALTPFRGETRLFIRPGFRFRVADALMTNFHMPRSTLLMLVAAFVGFERMRAIYAHALDAGYRFASYGDASLLWRPDVRP